MNKIWFIAFQIGIVLSVLNVVQAEPVDTHTPTLQVHGFVAQGIIDVDGSDFVNDDQSLSAELTEAGINFSYDFSPSIRAAGQAVYLNGGNRYAEGARVDYFLIDWTAYSSEDWKANLYLGRYKNTHWLYSGTRDVAFTRPSIILPQAIYFDGFRDIAVGADGAFLALSRNTDDFGEFDFNISSGSSNISKDQTEIILGEQATGEMETEKDVQASFYWRPFLSSWRFGIVGLDSEFSYKRGDNDIFTSADITLQRFMVNAIFEGEYWEFSGEGFQERFVLDGLYFDGFHRDTKGQGAFVQSRYKVSQQATLLARAEVFYADKDDRDGKELEEITGGMVPHYFGYQHDLTLGAQYDFTDNLRLQMEYHWVKGTARLTPVVNPNVKVNNQERWDMWALQLMYWF